MKKSNIQKKNFKKYILLTLILSGINIFGMNSTQELKNLNIPKNEAVSPAKEFILELECHFRAIIKIFAAMIKKPSYINTDYDLKQEFKNYLKDLMRNDQWYSIDYKSENMNQFIIYNIQESKNRNQFIIDNIEAILSDEGLYDKIEQGQDEFPIKKNFYHNKPLAFYYFNETSNSQYIDYIVPMILRINEIFSEILSKTENKLIQQEELIFPQRIISYLKLEIELFEYIFEDLQKCLKNILDNKTTIGNSCEIFEYTDPLSISIKENSIKNSIKENNEKIKEIKAIINALRKEDSKEVLKKNYTNKQLTNLEKENKELNNKYQEQIKKTKQIIQEFQKERNNKNKQLTNLEKENKELKKRYQEQIEKTKQIIQEFEEKAKAKEIELQKKINNQNEQLTNLKKENTELNNKYQKQIEKTKQIIQEFEEKAKAKEIELQKKINNQNEQLTNLEKENKELNNKYQKQIEKTEEIIKEFQEKAKTKEIELQKEINNQNEQLTNLKKENKELNNKYQKQIEKTEEIIKEFQEKAKAKEIELQKEINNQNEQLTNLKKENTELKKKLEKIEFIKNEKNKELRKLEKELQKQIQYKESTKFFNDLLLKNIKPENKLPNEEGKIKDYEQELERKNREIADYKQQIISLEFQVGDQNSTIGKLKNNYEKNLERKNREIADYKQQITDYKREISFLKLKNRKSNIDTRYINKKIQK